MLEIFKANMQLMYFLTKPKLLFSYFNWLTKKVYFFKFYFNKIYIYTNHKKVKNKKTLIKTNAYLFNTDTDCELINWKNFNSQFKFFYTSIEFVYSPFAPLSKTRSPHLPQLGRCIDLTAKGLKEHPQCGCSRNRDHQSKQSKELPRHH